MMMIKIVNSAVTAVPSFLREGSNQAIRCDEITMMIIILLFGIMMLIEAYTVHHSSHHSDRREST